VIDGGGFAAISCDSEPWISLVAIPALSGGKRHSIVYEDWTSGSGVGVGVIANNEPEKKFIRKTKSKINKVFFII